MIKEISLSVHDIVDTLLRKGHLDTRVFNESSMAEGSRLHTLYQGEQGADYLSEYPVYYTFRTADYVINVSGKADGVIIAPDGSLTVEEIKTTVADLTEFMRENGEWHQGQAFFYAFIIGKQKNVDQVNVVMTYLKQGNYHISKKISHVYTMKELSDYIDYLILKYSNYLKKIEVFKDERNKTVKSLIFPFNDYREGQKELMDFVDKSVENNREVFVEAPTGIGKTISVLYPTVKRFGEEKADQIFYLTSKNSIKQIALKTMKLMIDSGVKVKTIEFTSKENICFNDKKRHCNPDECPFAKNFYDKLLEAIFDALNEYDYFDRKTIEKLCYERTMCPFEFQLSLSHYCDVLVCDYNYVYDFHDHLGIHEGSLREKNAYLLVDECHNLPDRVRDMYSCEIELKELRDALYLCAGKEFSVLKKDINQLIKNISLIPIDFENETVKKEHIYQLKDVNSKIEGKVFDIITDIKLILKKHTALVSDALLNFFYNLNSFYTLCTYLDDPDTKDAFLTYCRIDNDDFISSLKIADLDSKKLIKNGSELFKGVVYFSATLSPKDYYIDLLGGDINDTSNRMVLPSPFPFFNRKVLIDASLSLKYKDRSNTLKKVYELIKTAVERKTGNYFVFCPSFDYLQSLSALFDKDESVDFHVIPQSRNMSESARKEFLNTFQSEVTTSQVGLLVLGGVFSEGIDLIGDRLIGAIIISVGLPQIGFEKNKLMEYYDKISGEENSHKGFNYAYAYPGCNKVLQAAGRVIRSETDQGFMLFIDNRFNYSLYRDIFSEIYPDAYKVVTASGLKYQLETFWEDCSR